jgi:hypothetical protein
MLDNFMSPTAAWWENYEELHFMQDGAPRYSALPVGMVHSLKAFVWSVQ